jgi:hypothetical protein
MRKKAGRKCFRPAFVMRVKGEGRPSVGLSPVDEMLSLLPAADALTRRRVFAQGMHLEETPASSLSFSSHSSPPHHAALMKPGRFAAISVSSSRLPAS